MRVNSVVYNHYKNKYNNNLKLNTNNINYNENIHNKLMPAPIGYSSYGIVFGYNNILKDLFKSGKLPSVKIGLYGDTLTKKNVTLEHLIPHSKKGPNKLFNFALASKAKNELRANFDIRDYLTPDMAKKYLKQFKDITIFQNKEKIFDGNSYIEMIENTLTTLGLSLK